MADINARGAAEPTMGRRLERKDRKYAIYIIAHGPGAPRAPRPYRRRDIVNDRDRRHLGAHPAGDAVGEIGAVDDDDRVRTGGDDRIGRFPDSPQDHRQTPRNRADADNGEIVDRKRTSDPGRRHGAAADAREVERGAAGHERPRQRGPERVAGFLRRNEMDRQRPRHAVHADFSSGTPTKKMFARSAAAVSRSGSATIVAPAVTARPARPARATFSTVCGPMAGRSKR